MFKWVWPITAIIAVIIAGSFARATAKAINARPVVPVVRTVIHTVTPKPTVVIKHRVKTVTVSDPAETSCIANLWHSYIALANGGPAGDPSLFITDCPGVHINGLGG
jgi:hypothetical protein